jgi:Holliday junction resolvase RusA-like endonuclease
MATTYNFFVPGVPRPQPRPRMARNGHIYTPKSADAWKTAVMSAFLIRQKFKVTPIESAVSLRVIFFMPSIKKSGSPHIAIPDIDNLLKSTMDALTRAGAWEDDCQVCQVTAEKRHAVRKDEVGAEILISAE